MAIFPCLLPCLCALGVCWWFFPAWGRTISFPELISPLRHYRQETTHGRASQTPLPWAKITSFLFHGNWAQFSSVRCQSVTSIKRFFCIQKQITYSPTRSTQKTSGHFQWNYAGFWEMQLFALTMSKSLAFFLPIVPGFEWVCECHFCAWSLEMCERLQTHLQTFQNFAPRASGLNPGST